MTQTKKNKLPSLGWCNILVSRLRSHDTLRAMGLESNRDLQKTELYDQRDIVGRVRRPRGRWLRYDANFGKYARHPLEIPNEFSRVIWAHREPWPVFLSDQDRKKVPGAYGVVLRTKELAVLDILWAIKYVKRAVALDPKASELTILRGGTAAMMKRVQNYNDKLDLLARLFQPPYLPTTFRIRPFCRLLLTRTFKVFYCNEQGEVKDISSLDPGSKDEDVATWGHLSGVTVQAGAIVRTCVNQYLDR